MGGARTRPCGPRSINLRTSQPVVATGTRVSGPINEKPLGVADYLDRLTGEQLSALQASFRQIAAYGQQAHPRIAVTAALNEACHLAFSGYEDCRGAYEKLRERCKPGILPEVNDKNFRNFVQRQTMTGKTFDLFEAMCLTADIHLNPDSAFARWRDTLTPYQSWLIDWGKGVIASGVFTPPRASDDTGTRSAGGTGSSGYRVHQFVEGFREIQSLGELDSLCPASPGVAHFNYFRAGLDKPQTFIQAHLRILRPIASRSEYNTFDMFYDFGGHERFAGGVVIPTLRTIYLMGVQGWGALGKSEVAKSSSLRNPAEIIAIPRDKITGGAEFIPALTMTTDSTDTLLCSRIALRRTTITDRQRAGIGGDEIWKLGARLIALDREEARLAVDEDENAQTHTDTAATGRELVDSSAAERDPQLQRRINELSAMLNNITARSFVDLQGPDGLMRSQLLDRRIAEALAGIFQDGLGNAIYQDQNDAPYEERLHWRAPALRTY